MMSKYFKGKKMKLNQKPSTPRALDVITQELNQECWSLGQLEYQVFVLNQAIETSNKKIQTLNYEGASRKELDKATQPNLEVTNDQSQPVQG